METILSAIEEKREVLYLIRGVNNKIAAEFYERVNDIAKVLACGAAELMENSELLAKAKAEHKTRVGEGYVPPIPKDVKPIAMDALRK